MSVTCCRPRLDPMKRSGASVVVCEAAVSTAAVSHLVMLCHTRYDTNLLKYGTIQYMQRILKIW